MALAFRGVSAVFSTILHYKLHFQTFLPALMKTLIKSRIFAYMPLLWQLNLLSLAGGSKTQIRNFLWTKMRKVFLLLKMTKS